MRGWRGGGAVGVGGSWWFGRLGCFFFGGGGVVASLALRVVFLGFFSFVSL